MKRFTRCVCLILAVSMLFAVPAFAAESRSSRFFISSIAYLYRQNTVGRAFEVCFDVVATHTMDELGVNFIKVQQSTDGENWTTVKTFTKEEYHNLTDTNALTHMGYVVYTGTRGYYYRAFMQLYAKDSTGTAYMPRYTGSMYLD